jgi:hypothetical protein
MSDENDDEIDLEDIRDQATSTSMAGMFSPMFDNLMFSGDVSHEQSQELKIAIRMMKAGSALNEFMDYVEEHDIELTDIGEEDMQELTYEQRMIVFGFISMAEGLEKLGHHVEDDDDDNPFKVSDGDDPIY